MVREGLLYVVRKRETSRCLKEVKYEKIPIELSA